MSAEACFGVTPWSEAPDGTHADGAFVRLIAAALADHDRRAIGTHSCSVAGKEKLRRHHADDRARERIHPHGAPDDRPDPA